MRRTRVGQGIVIGVVAVALMSIGEGASAHRGRCSHVRGLFSSVPATDCTSPVGICTDGRLYGRLAGDYDFVMAQMIAPNDDSVPTVVFFTGASLITTDNGMLVGTDTGALDLDPIGDGAFSTLLTVTDGTDRYEGARGHLQIRGNLDFTTGAARGDYKGRICRN